jgi:hypothetical protein
VGRCLLVAAATAVAAAVVVFGARLLGTTSATFAFLVVWAPMTWLGTLSRIIQPRLPPRYHALRNFERDPRLYELLGVKLVKRLLRRGPLAVFNPGLHLPAERSPERLAELEQRMKDAEASHFLLLVALLGVVINAAARGWWVAAGLTLVFDVVLNGYPVMLQRHNRILLHARFPAMQDGVGSAEGGAQEVDAGEQDGDADGGDDDQAPPGSHFRRGLVGMGRMGGHLHR